MTPALFVYTDGGARGNPGPGAAAFIVQDTTRKILFKRGVYLGNTTNNVAEYKAVILALEWLTGQRQSEKILRIVFNLDSQLVVNQLNGIFKVKDAKLRPLILKIRQLENGLSAPVSYQAIAREKNFLADELVNQILDSRLAGL